MLNLNTKQLLEKEITRQEFLKILGLIILGVVGLPQIVALLQHSMGPKTLSSKTNRGYGSNPYGL
jgi:hypothetical protein